MVLCLLFRNSSVAVPENLACPQGADRADREWHSLYAANRGALADIAAGTALRYLAVRFPQFDWPALHPGLGVMSARPAFAATVPVPQSITEKVV